MAPLSTFEKTNLDRQGFDCLDDEAKRLYALPLRFTPFVATAGVVIGLILHSSLWLAAMALIALSGVLLPRGMLIDVAYNLGVRHLFRAAPLPSTPTPRRFSYLLSTTLLTGSALSFHLGAPLAGYVLGGLVAIGGATLTITLWCLGSWTWALVLNGVAALAHGGRPALSKGADSGNDPSDEHRDVLDERFARGEINERDSYARRAGPALHPAPLTTLTATRPRRDRD